MLMPVLASAQSAYPSVSPSATYTDDNGLETETSSAFQGQAPLTVLFRANPQNVDGLSPVYEWHFRRHGETKDMMVRYEQDTEYTFTQAGETYVTLVFRPDPNDEGVDSVTITVTISESKLVMPNAFSPNDDGRNDVYQPKEYQSLVEFHAYIFNRWGQKLYEWDNPATGWDGKYNGTPVKEGVYYVLIKARGADGVEYNIRKDVNLLRGYIKSE
jgi:gliding motility-associated-like protein